MPNNERKRIIHALKKAIKILEQLVEALEDTEFEEYLRDLEKYGKRKKS